MVFKNRIRQRTMTLKEYELLVQQSKKFEQDKKHKDEEFIPIMIG